MNLNNPSISTMCLYSIKHAAKEQADRHAQSDHGDQLIVLAMRVLVKAIEKELREVTA